MRLLGLDICGPADGEPNAGHEWLRTTLLPLYRSPAGPHWGWLAHGWLLSTDGSKRPFPAACLVETSYEASSITLGALQDDGWFRLAVDPPCNTADEPFWSHRTLLAFGEHKLTVESWQDFFFPRRHLTAVVPSKRSPSRTARRPGIRHRTDHMDRVPSHDHAVGSARRLDAHPRILTGQLLHRRGRLARPVTRRMGAMARSAERPVAIYLVTGVLTQAGHGPGGELGGTGQPQFKVRCHGNSFGRRTADHEDTHRDAFSRRQWTATMEPVFLLERRRVQC